MYAPTALYGHSGLCRFVVDLGRPVSGFGGEGRAKRLGVKAVTRLPSKESFSKYFGWTLERFGQERAVLPRRHSSGISCISEDPDSCSLAETTMARSILMDVVGLRGPWKKPLRISIVSVEYQGLLLE